MTTTVQMDIALDLSCLEHVPAMLRKAIDILKKIAQGVDWRQLNGKKLVHSDVVSVPVGHRFRILFSSCGMKPLQIMTHENYNKVVNNVHKLKLLLK